MRAWRALIGALGGVLLAAAAGQSARAAAAAGAFELPARGVWAGQVFDLSLAWRVDWSAFGNMEGPLAWTPEPLVAEPWSPPALADVPPGPGPASATIRFKTRALALTPGRLVLRPARQVMVMRTGTVRMSDYERAITAPIPMESATATLEVRPLPPPPPGFSGAVGRFSLTSSVDHAQVKVGEAVTWTVVMAGVGNWPAIRGVPTRQASRDFDVSGSPRAREEPGAGLFERALREEVTLVPRRAGRYVLGAVELVAFDPDVGRYVTVRTPALSLDVQPGAGDLAALEAANEAAAATKAAEDRLPALLAGRGRSTPPMPDAAWTLGLAAAPLAALALWLLLALQRARSRDPEREARAADARLRATLERLAATGDGAERRRLVRAWQRDVPLRLKLGRAAPVPQSFADEAWRRLWAEADRFLYGRAGALPQDWPERAQRRWRDQAPPRPFRPAALFRREALLPAICALVVATLGLLAPTPSAAQGATEALFRAALQRDPLDWRARHDLAVTLAARDRWDEAAGQAAVAWVQQPAAPQTRDLWLMTARKAGYSAEPRASVPRPRGAWGRALALASPAAWRWLALAMAWLAVAGAAVVLLGRFGGLSRRLAPLGLALLLAGVLGGVAATAALGAYGTLASRDAVLLWHAAPLRAVPVDTPAEAAPAQIAAGTPGRVEQAFLGWRRVRFGDGRAGWLREQDLIAVWTAVPRG